MQVDDKETRVSDERFLDIKSSFLSSSYFTDLCSFRIRCGYSIAPNDLKEEVSRDILYILSDLSNRQEIMTLVGLKKII